MLPIAALGVLTIPVAAGLIKAHGSRAALVLGSVVLLVRTCAVQLLGDHTTVLLIIGFSLLLGVPNGFNNLGLQTSLYESAPAGRGGGPGAWCAGASPTCGRHRLAVSRPICRTPPVVGNGPVRCSALTGFSRHLRGLADDRVGACPDTTTVS